MTKTEQILEFARTYPEGFTLDLRSRKLLDLDYGYVVAIEATQGCTNIPELLRIAKRHNLHLVGGWWDETDKEYHFDACTWFDSREAAVTFAESQNQKALFDVANENVIDLRINLEK